MTCRCGWDGTGDHPCHYLAYTCRKPAKERVYVPTMKFSLAGTQPKFSVTKTFACDKCWAHFTALLEEVREEEAQDASLSRRTDQHNGPG